jgi:hypothetical protein
MPRTSPYRIELTVAERRLLEARARKYTSPYRDVIRAKIVLLAAAGVANDASAARLDTPADRQQVAQALLPLALTGAGRAAPRRAPSPLSTPASS